MRSQLNKYFLVFLVALVCFSTATMAQDAKRAQSVLDAMSAKYQGLKSFKVVFNYSEEGTRPLRGEAIVKGDKYILKMADQIVTSDGKVMATFMKDVNEVTLQEDMPETLGDFAPTQIFNAYKKGFTNSFLGESKIGNTEYERVRMIPTKSNGQVTKVELLVSKSDKTIKSWKVFAKGSKGMNFEVVEFLQNIATTDAQFQFNKKDYPKAEIIDLR